MTDSLRALDDLHDRIAIVTGAARGLGLASARRLAEAGATVVLVDLDGPGVEAAAAGLVRAGHRAEGATADLTDEAQVQRLVDGVVATHGRVDVLVNLAAVFPAARIEEMSLAFWHRVLTGSLDTTFLCCRAVLPHMRRAGFGRIINTASGTVHLGPPGHAAYVTAKMGVIGFTRCLANDAGTDGITANVIMPGAIDTEGTRELRSGDADPTAAVGRLVARQAIKRRGEPDDVAAAVCWIAGPTTDFLTGQVVNVGGGISFTG